MLHVERALRQQLEEKFGGVDLSDRKPLIRTEVSETLAYFKIDAAVCVDIACPLQTKTNAAPPSQVAALHPPPVIATASLHHCREPKLDPHSGRLSCPALQPV